MDWQWERGWTESSPTLLFPLSSKHSDCTQIRDQIPVHFAVSHSGYYNTNSNVYIHCLISVYFMSGCHITVQESCIAWGGEKKPSLGDTVHLPTISLGCLKDSKDVGEGGPVFSVAQEAAIVNLSLANNSIRQREIQSGIMRNNTVFNNIQQVSLSASAFVLRRYWVHMQQLHMVPVERNSQRIKRKKSET